MTVVLPACVSESHTLSTVVLPSSLSESHALMTVGLPASLSESHELTTAVLSACLSVRSLLPCSRSRTEDPQVFHDGCRTLPKASMSVPFPLVSKRTTKNTGLMKLQCWSNFQLLSCPRVTDLKMLPAPMIYRVTCPSIFACNRSDCQPVAAIVKNVGDSWPSGNKEVASPHICLCRRK